MKKLGQIKKFADYSSDLISYICLHNILYMFVKMIMMYNIPIL